MAKEYKKYVMKDSNDYRPNNDKHEVLLINSVNGQDIAFGVNVPMNIYRSENLLYGTSSVNWS